MSDQLALDFIPDRKRAALIFIETQPWLFRDDFHEWLSKNFIVWEKFRHEADRVWNRGRPHYSARTIGEFLRHETTVAEQSNELQLKLNDHYWPDLARLYVCFHPERRDFFEFRPGQSARRAA